MDNPADLLPESNSGDRLNTWVAVIIALLASFMALTKVKDDNIVQAMLQAKSDAVDTWSEYQSKSIKQHLADLGRNQAIAFTSTVPQHERPKWDEQVKHYEEEIARYKKEQEELKKKAREFEGQYDALNFRDDQFDLSDAILSVAISTLAMTSLTRKRWLLWLSMVFGTVGVVMGLAGLIGLGIHPDWIIKLFT